MMKNVELLFNQFLIELFLCKSTYSKIKYSTRMYKVSGKKMKIRKFYRVQNLVQTHHFVKRISIARALVIMFRETMLYQRECIQIERNYQQYQNECQFHFWFKFNKF